MSESIAPPELSERAKAEFLFTQGFIALIRSFGGKVTLSLQNIALSAGKYELLAKTSEENPDIIEFFTKEAK